uniref:hypothetical protein n=1 Tax=Klebsiella pneumoniae TaxID=573 RepID=UPI001952FD35
RNCFADRLRCRGNRARQENASSERAAGHASTTGDTFTSSNTPGRKLFASSDSNAGAEREKYAVTVPN